MAKWDDWGTWLLVIVGIEVGSVGLTLLLRWLYRRLPIRVFVGLLILLVTTGVVFVGLENAGERVDFAEFLAAPFFLLGIVSLIVGPIWATDALLRLLWRLGRPATFSVTVLFATAVAWLSAWRFAVLSAIEQLAALNRALFTLAMQKNAVISYRRKFQQFDTPTKLALAMPAMKPPRYENLRQDFEALNFLLALEKADLLIRLAVEDERFHQTFESIRLRSDYYHDVVFPELVRHELAGKNVTDLLLESTLGERIWKSALFYAEEMQDHVNKSMESISHLHTDLHSAAEAMFPEKKFTAFDFEAPPNSPVKRP